MDEQTLTSISQAIESMILLSNELDKSIKEKNILKINNIKKEILNFQNNISETLKQENGN